MMVLAAAYLVIAGLVARFVFRHRRGAVAAVWVGAVWPLALLLVTLVTVVGFVAPDDGLD